MKKLIVNFLEYLCNWFHWLPPHKCRLADLSLKLNDKWGLSEWGEAKIS